MSLNNKFTSTSTSIRIIAPQSNIVSVSSTQTNNSSTSPSTQTSIQESEPFPQIVVFDLDFTLWPFWVDTHLQPPFRRVARTKLHPNTPIVDVRNNDDERLTLSNISKDDYHYDNTEIVDSRNHIIKLYPDVRKIFHDLEKHKVTIAIASRTTSADDAEALLSILPSHPSLPYKENSTMWDLISTEHAEMYDKSKINHFRYIAKRSGVAFHDMLFFDDDDSNIDTVSSLGVTSIYLPEEAGVNWKLYQKGLQLWRKQYYLRNNLPIPSTTTSIPSLSTTGSSSIRNDSLLSLSSSTTTGINPIATAVEKKSWTTTSCPVPDHHYIFVYGSLRAGLHNHWKLKDLESIFICNGDTDERLTMLGLSSLAFPYVTRTNFPNVSTNFIKGEIYQVNNKAIEVLDQFEGVPNHYNRSLIRIFPDPHEGHSSVSLNKNGISRQLPYGTPLYAYIYVVEDTKMLEQLEAGLTNKYERFRIVESGDWKEYVEINKK